MRSASQRGAEAGPIGHEAQRIEALRGYGILDTPPDEAFDDLVRLAARLTGTPMAMVSLLDSQRAWFKARVGLDVGEVPRDIAFCAHAVLQPDEPMIVPDATEDARFANHPLVIGPPRARFYAGFPLVTPDGHALGALCVLDREPRRLPCDQVEVLCALARQVMRLLELHGQRVEQKRAEEELRQSGARYRQLVDASPDAIFIHVDDRIAFANPATERLFGGNARQPLVGRPIRDFFHPDQQSAISQRCAAVLRGQAVPQQVLRRAKKLDGTAIYVETSLSACEFKGSPALQVVVRDVTKRVMAERALQESERWLAAIIDNIPDGAWLKNKEGQYLIVNRAFCKFFGVEAEHVVGKTSLYMYTAELARKVREGDAEVLASGGLRCDELQVSGKDGTPTWFETRKAPILDEHGIPCGVAGIARNITQRKKDEAALLESKRFLQSTLDALSAHIAILDENGAIIAVNAAWSQFARQNAFPGSDFGIGANYLELCAAATGECAEEASAVARGIRAVMAGESEEFLLEYPCHSLQEPRWFVVRVTRFQGAGPVRIVVAHENITARKRAEEDLQRKIPLP